MPANCPQQYLVPIEGAIHAFMGKKRPLYFSYKTMPSSNINY